MTTRRGMLAAVAALVLFATPFGSALGAARADASPPPASITALPPAPERALVERFCTECHGIDWILRSGGTQSGWTDRIQRMIRGGAPVPPEQIPALAAYLAKALPPRPLPPSP